MVGGCCWSFVVGKKTVGATQTFSTGKLNENTEENATNQPLTPHMTNCLSNTQLLPILLRNSFPQPPNICWVKKYTHFVKTTRKDVNSIGGAVFRDSFIPLPQPERAHVGCSPRLFLPKTYSLLTLGPSVSPGVIKRFDCSPCRRKIDFRVCQDCHMLRVIQPECAQTSLPSTDGIRRLGLRFLPLMQTKAP